MMVENFDVCFHDPEDYIIRKLDVDRSMYLIAKGTCIVTYDGEEEDVDVASSISQKPKT